MVVIKNVAQIGARGSLGTPVLEALVKSGKFNVTVLVRSSTKATYPSSVKTVTVDYEDVASLTKALTGIDAIVSTVGTEGLQGQKLVIDAAIAAGVKRFLPSEFGSDLSIPQTAALPVFAYKIETQKYVEEKAASNPDFTYTYVRNGGFLDWGLAVNFLLDLASGKPVIFEGGDQKFSSTTLASVGQAVVGVLEHPDETKNRTVSVQDIAISQNKLLALAKKVAPEKTKSWEPVPKSIASIKKESDEALAKGDFSAQYMYNYIYVSILGAGYGGLMEKNDNELVGVAGKTDADVEAILANLLK